MSTLVPLEYGQYYHIYNRGNNGENIFLEERNYTYFMKLYAHHIEPIAETFAYCLLRNHFHLLVRLKLPQEQPEPVLDAARSFANLFNSYAKSINKAYGRTGSLFEKPFRRIVVTEPRYYSCLVHYIHFNPQKHGFVDDFRQYPFSSYQTLLSGKPTRLRRDDVLDWFGGKDAFVALHQELADEKAIISLIQNDVE